MVNYNFIDTGPPVHAEQRKSGSKKLLNLTPVSKRPGSPPRYEEQSPPSFFEPGNRVRWLLLLLPFCYTAYRYNEISPLSLSTTHFPEFYALFSICCALTTYLALQAKRRKLTNLLYTEPTAYYLEKIRRGYNKLTNTTFTSLLCIATGIAKAIQEYIAGNNAAFEISSTLTATLIFLLLYKAHSYNKCLAAHGSEQPPTQGITTTIFNLKNINYE